MSRTLGWMTATALLLTTTLARADDPEKTRKVRQFRAGPVAIAVADGGASGEAIRLGEYWIGVECRPVVDPTLRSQLGLTETQGLVVLGLAEESPAAKAGIREHDVLLTAGGQALGKVQDLIDAVEKAKEQKVSVELLRGGKKMKLDVQPAKRPPSATGGAPRGYPLVNPGDLDWKSIQKLLERSAPGGGGDGAFQFHMLRPGAILPPGAPWQPELPNGMTISITRTGSEPAKIVVQRGKERWAVTEKELDKLPADVRGHVERMLSPWHGVGYRAVPDAAPVPGAQENAAQEIENLRKNMAKQMQDTQKQVEKQMQEMNRQMEKMRKSMQEIEKTVPKPKTPEKTNGNSI